MIGGAGFDGGGQLVAFHCGHGEIGDDEIELAWLEHRQGVLAVAGDLDLMAVEAEHHLDGVADERLVVNHQNLARRKSRGSHWHINWGDFKGFWRNGQ